MLPKRPRPCLEVSKAGWLEYQQPDEAAAARSSSDPDLAAQLKATTITSNAVATKRMSHIEASLKDGSAFSKHEPNMYTTKGKRGLHKMPVTNATIALIMIFFRTIALNLHKAVCAPDPVFVASFYMLLQTIASEQHPGGAVAWVDPHPLYALLFATSPIVFITDWRPFLDGLTNKVSEIGKAPSNAGMMRLQCLATYMKPL